MLRRYLLFKESGAPEEPTDHIGVTVILNAAIAELKDLIINIRPFLFEICYLMISNSKAGFRPLLKSLL